MKKDFSLDMIMLASDCLEWLLEDSKLRVVVGFYKREGLLPEKVRVTRAKNLNGIHIEIGKPNYAEREYLKRLKKNGMKIVDYRVWKIPMKGKTK